MSIENINVPPDSSDKQTILEILGLREGKMLEKLAAYSGRTLKEELRALVRRRALGHLKDLGDDRGSFRVYESEIPKIHVDSVEIHEE